MASDLDFVEFVVGQMEDAGAITFRKMFGGITLYCEGKVVGLDDHQCLLCVRFGGQTDGVVENAPVGPGKLRPQPQ